MPCDYSPYTLPTIDFVGGETQNLMFRTYYYKENSPFDLSGCSAGFSVISYTNKNGTPVLTKTMTLNYGDESSVENILSVKLDPADTVNLNGKYIYQISIKDANGNVEIPKQGILLITNNIHKDFIR